MTTFTDLSRGPVQLTIYAENDRKYKHPLHTHESTLEFDEPVMPLLATLKVSSNQFKLQLPDKQQDCESAFEILKARLSTLNHVMTLMAVAEFPIFVVKHINQALKTLPQTLCNEHGYIHSSYLYKEYFAKAIEAYLRNEDVNATVQMQKGTLYVDDIVLINSGVTDVIYQLSSGLNSFWRFMPDNMAVQTYDQEVEKAPHGAFEAGQWHNKVGDTILLSSFQLVLQTALANFLSQFSDKMPEHDIIVDELKDKTQRLVESHQKYLDESLNIIPISRDKLMASPLIKESEAYQEVTSLCLGENALDLFYTNDTPMILINAIAECLGAFRAYRLDALKSAKNADKHGYHNEDFCEHVALPHTKVRKAMLVFKEQLNDPTSLIGACFDKDKIKLNVSAEYSYDPEFNRVNSAVQHLDVVFGSRYPVGEQKHVIRFAFNGIEG